MIIIGVLVVIVLILAIVNISFGSTSNRSNSNSSSNSSISSIFKHAPELFFRKRRNAGLLVWGGEIIQCLRMFLNITFALALVTDKGRDHKLYW